MFKCQVPCQFVYDCFDVVTIGITTDITQLHLNYVYQIAGMKTIHMSLNSAVTLTISITTCLESFSFLACLYMSI
jgi:acid phosphatase family membrane protein YuiD